jgi:hemerythrin-like metal-binding protein
MTGASFIVWKDDYLVGHDVLDMHHRRMLAIINSLYHAMAADEAESQLASLFQGVVDYGQMHFQAEESILRKVEYPNLREHEAMHQAYVQRVGGLMRERVVTPHNLSLDVLQFLKEWWLNHILEMDKAYAPYLGARE